MYTVSSTLLPVTCTRDRQIFFYVRCGLLCTFISPLPPEVLFLELRLIY